MIDVRSPSPSISTLCGTIIGVFSLYVPAATLIFIPGLAAFTAARIVFFGLLIASPSYSSLPFGLTNICDPELPAASSVRPNVIVFAVSSAVTSTPLTPLIINTSLLLCGVTGVPFAVNVTNAFCTEPIFQYSVPLFVYVQRFSVSFHNR